MSDVYAEVRNGVVVNTFIWDGQGRCPVDEDSAIRVEPTHYADTPEGEPIYGAQVGVGWEYRDGMFIKVDNDPVTWDAVRWERDDRLMRSDWTQFPDAPLTDAEKQAWADYRQTLRDIPQTQDDPDSIVWPETP